MKRLLCLALSVIMILSCFVCTTAFANSDIKVIVNGKNLEMDQPPVLVSDRTLVPVRAIFEALGAVVTWDDATQTAYGKKGDMEIQIQINNNIAYVYGKPFILDVPAQLIGGRTLVPVRFISETLGEKVSWNNDTQTVHITSSLVGKHIYDIPVTEREGKNLRPDITNTGKTYDDLIFYDRAFAEEDTRTPDEIFASLTGGVEVLDPNQLFTGYRGGAGKCAEFKIVDVPASDGVPFSKAMQIEVTKVPQNYWEAEILVGSLNERLFKTGDTMLLVGYVKTEAANNEMQRGTVSICVQNSKGANAAETTVKASNDGWKKIYLPFVADLEKSNVNAKYGYLLQKQLIGGFKVYNFGNTPIENLPQSEGAGEYDKRELFNRDEQWRRDAWDRIEQIRKGDIKVIVKDANGKVIPDADVKLDMYDHEFHWGSLSAGYSKSDEGKESSAIKRYGTSLLFNGAVSSVNHKWQRYETVPEDAIAELNNALNAGIKYYRGHVLVAGNPTSCIDEAGNYKGSEIVPEDVAKLAYEGKWDEVKKRIKEHIYDQAGAWSGKITDWDVTNELLQAYGGEYLTQFGKEGIKEIYEWAQDADPIGKMYMNDTSIVGLDNGRADAYYSFIKELLDMGAPIDGIGVQGHMAQFASPLGFYNEMVQLASLGLDMKITEFDFPKEMYEEDPEAEASLFRDILLLLFSIENFEGFYFWGHNEWHWRQNAPIFDANWNVKPCGEQFMDLVYNKWWTQEDGKTDANGTYSTRGYYGEYLITATKDGKTATVDTKCFKGNNNTIEIVLK